MKEEHNFYEGLITRYLSGEASQEEVEALLKWMEKDEANKDLFFQSKKIWNEAGTLKIYFDRNKEWKKLHRKITRFYGNDYHGFWTRVAQIGAVLILVFVVGWFVKNHISKEPEISWLKVEVPTGQITQLTLSDSSKIWLNSESTFRYPSDFSKERRVVLSGEAYFEITEDKESPFTVETDCVDVQVLGTRFNVSAYEEDSAFHTVLLEGKVALNDKTSGKPRSVLYPGDQAMLNRNNNRLNVYNLGKGQNKAIGWMDGRYEFQDEPLGQILNVASRWYDVEFVVKDKELRDTRFTGVMKRDSPPNQLLKLIRETEDVHIRKSGDKIILRTET